MKHRYIPLNKRKEKENKEIKRTIKTNRDKRVNPSTSQKSKNPINVQQSNLSGFFTTRPLL